MKLIEDQSEEKRINADFLGSMTHNVPPLHDYKLSSGYKSAKALEDLLHWLLRGVSQGPSHSLWD